MTESSEKRRYPRLKSSKQLLVVWKLGSQKYVSTVENMGLGGLFIRTENPPKAGTTLQLLFNTPEGEVRGLAAVRICSPGKGMGPRAPHAVGPLAAQALSARGIAHPVRLKKDSTLTQAQNTGVIVAPRIEL